MSGHDRQLGTAAEHGRAQLRLVLPKGKYTVWATYPELPEADAYDVPAGSQGVRVQFTKSATLSGRAEDASGSASGRVAGKPLGAFSVYAALSHDNDATPQLKSTRGYVQQRVTLQDPAGAFEITNLHPAIYDLLVVTPDRRIGRVEGIRVEAGETKRGLRVVLGEGTRVRGRLVDAENGQPAAGLWVNLGLAILHEGVKAVTDAQGVFILDGIPSGKSTLSLPGDPRTRVAQDEAIEIPANAHEHNLGTLRLTRKAPARGPSAARD